MKSKECRKVSGQCLFWAGDTDETPPYIYTVGLKTLKLYNMVKM